MHPSVWTSATQIGEQRQWRGRHRGTQLEPQHRRERQPLGELVRTRQRYGGWGAGLHADHIERRTAIGHRRGHHSHGSNRPERGRRACRLRRAKQSNTITCPASELANGASLAYTLMLHFDSMVGPDSMSATLVSDLPDSTPTNNSTSLMLAMAAFDAGDVPTVPE